MPLESDPIDLLLDADGDLVVEGADLQLSSGTTAVNRGIAGRLNSFLGEWFLNLDDGVPWYQQILGEKYDQVIVNNAIRVPILATPGVTEIISLDSSFDNATRVLLISWKVMTEFGDTATDTLPITVSP